MTTRRRAGSGRPNPDEDQLPKLRHLAHCGCRTQSGRSRSTCGGRRWQAHWECGERPAPRRDGEQGRKPRGPGLAIRVQAADDARHKGHRRAQQLREGVGAHRWVPGREGKVRPACPSRRKGARQMQGHQGGTAQPQGLGAQGARERHLRSVCMRECAAALRFTILSHRSSSDLDSHTAPAMVRTVVSAQATASASATSPEPIDSTSAIPALAGSPRPAAPRARAGRIPRRRRGLTAARV